MPSSAADCRGSAQELAVTGRVPSRADWMPTARWTFLLRTDPVARGAVRLPGRSSPVPSRGGGSGRARAGTVGPVGRGIRRMRGMRPGAPGRGAGPGESGIAPPGDGSGRTRKSRQCVVCESLEKQPEFSALRRVPPEFRPEILDAAAGGSPRNVRRVFVQGLCPPRGHGRAGPAAAGGVAPFGRTADSRLLERPNCAGPPFE